MQIANHRECVFILLCVTIVARALFSVSSLVSHMQCDSASLPECWKRIHACFWHVRRLQACSSRSFTAAECRLLYVWQTLANQHVLVHAFRFAAPHCHLTRFEERSFVQDAHFGRHDCSAMFIFASAVLKPIRTIKYLTHTIFHNGWLLLTSSWSCRCQISDCVRWASMCVHTLLYIHEVLGQATQFPGLVTVLLLFHCAAYCAALAFTNSAFTESTLFIKFSAKSQLP